MLLRIIIINKIFFVCFWGYIYRGFRCLGLLDIVVLLRTPPIYGLSYPLSNPHILLLTIIINISKIYVDKYVDKLWISGYLLYSKNHIKPDVIRHIIPKITMCFSYSLYLILGITKLTFDTPKLFGPSNRLFI
jgi:hypothetical protein